MTREARYRIDARTARDGLYAAAVPVAIIVLIIAALILFVGNIPTGQAGGSASGPMSMTSHRV